MIIHDDGDGRPTEINYNRLTEDHRNPVLYSSEAPETTQNLAKMEKKRRRSTDASDDEFKLKIKHPKKLSNQSSSDIQGNSNTTEISKEDLLELRTVYKKCKTVMRKIEMKYGHLLEIDLDEEHLKFHGDHVDQEECQCILNKKIIFDEDGKEVSIGTPPSNHICPTKLSLKNNHKTFSNNLNKNIQIEYYEKNIELSNDVQELRRILQDPSIETTYRNKVIEKLKSIKQEHLNEVKFNKIALVEKLKTNPEEVISFNGANLSGITGYSHF